LWKFLFNLNEKLLIEKEPLKRRVTRLVNNAASAINKKTAKA
jgi:hypothetical protein